MDHNMLNQGLHIIANCKASTGDIWQPHFGAAGIAAYFFIQEHSIPPVVANRITTQARAMLDHHSFTESAFSTVEVHIPNAEHAILQSLQSVIDELHWVGHNVIYTALSLKAIRELGGWGTAREIEGICTLIESFRKTIPGRSWLGYSVAEVKRIEIAESDGFPKITNAKQLSAFILSELSSFQTIYRAEAHHDLIGHMLTFSHGLNILFDLGHEEYVRSGLPALLKLVKVLRASRDLRSETPITLRSPVDHLPLIQATRSKWLPLEQEYWDADFCDNDWDFGHVFKFPFSFYNHLTRVDSSTLDSFAADAIENFRYIIYSPFS
ncbi:hypothetical protein ACE3MZ_11585 [Paenibacillus sp. WLX1005]|uniref:hypothetical protein n=1 Tax=Paenibacillus sp. WLX1005 TaxID=3243766 RepID=UPI003984315E